MGPPLGQAMEFLSQALSQRGPQAVPYPENYKYNIREHLSDLLKMFPALVVATSEFHTNDGRILNLLRAHGTIPIHFQAVKYNIPIVIWMPERYPQQAPLVYVTPTPNMVIKQGHTYVDASGQVHTPYLLNWLFPSSDLSTMVQEMAMVFGAEPPLYSKPANNPAPPMQPPGYGSYGQPYAASQQQQQQQPVPSGYGAGAVQSPSSQQRPGAAPADLAAGQALWGGAYAAAMQHQQQGPPGQAQVPSPSNTSYPQGIPQGPLQAGLAQPPPAPAPQPAGPSPQEREKQELEGLFRGFAVKALQGRVQAGLEAYNRHATAEMEGLLEVQRALGQRGQELGRMVAAIQQERTGTEGLVAELGSKCRALEGWLEEHEWKLAALAQQQQQQQGKGSSSSGGAAGAQAVDVNKVVVPADELSRQALSAQAEDLAIEDALVVLDKALLQGKLPPDVYLKQVRLMCRKQFFARAKGLKVGQTQRQQAQARGAGAVGGSAYQLTHGDTWTHGTSTSIPLTGQAAK